MSWKNNRKGHLYVPYRCLWEEDLLKHPVKSPQCMSKDYVSFPTNLSNTLPYCQRLSFRWAFGTYSTVCHLLKHEYLHPAMVCCHLYLYLTGTEFKLNWRPGPCLLHTTWNPCGGVTYWIHLRFSSDATAKKYTVLYSIWNKWVQNCKLHTSLFIGRQVQLTSLPVCDHICRGYYEVWGKHTYKDTHSSVISPGL